MQVNFNSKEEKHSPVFRHWISMPNLKSTTLAWSEKHGLKSLFNRDPLSSLKMKNDACSVWNNANRFRDLLITWEGTTVFLSPKKTIASTKPNWFCTYRKRFKSEWCASAVTTKAPKISHQAKPWESTCFPRIILLWKHKMGMKSTKSSTTFLSSLKRSWMSKGRLLSHSESTMKRSRSSSMTKRKLRKN